MDPLRPCELSWDLVSTSAQTRQRLGSLARARGWTVRWSAQRFAIAHRSLLGRSHDVSLLRGRLEPRGEGSHLVCRPPAVDALELFLRGLTVLAALTLSVSIFLPGDFYVLPGVLVLGALPLNVVLIAVRDERQRAAVVALAAALADLRPTTPRGPFR
jgi:hypothetical protein